MTNDSRNTGTGEDANVHMRELILIPVGSQRSAVVSWNPNSEVDLAGYRVYYGSSPRAYSVMRDVGNTISDTVKTLIESQIYFFAVTAYDTANNESNFSIEVPYTVPSGIVGIELNFPLPSTTISSDSIEIQYRIIGSLSPLYSIAIRLDNSIMYDTDVDGKFMLRQLMEGMHTVAVAILDAKLEVIYETLPILFEVKFPDVTAPLPPRDVRIKKVN